MTKSLLLCLIIFSACQGRESESPDKAHTTTLSRTVSTSGLEAMIEYEPLQLNQVTPITLYLTQWQPAARPFSQVSLDAQFIQGRTGIQLKQISEISPGIYLMYVKPLIEGDAVLSLKINKQDEAIQIGGVYVGTDPKATFNYHSSTGIQMHKEDIWRAGLVTEVISTQPFAAVLKTTGKLVAAPGQETTLVANAPGVVHFRYRNITAGAPVQAGTDMFRITGAQIDNNVNIDLAIRQASLDLRLAEDEYQRAKLLIEDKLITQDKYQQALHQYQTSRIRLQHINKNYSAGGKRVIATASGYIGSVLVEEGQFVNAGDPLLTITNNRKLLLQAHVPVHDVDKVMHIKEAVFSPEYGNRVFRTSDLNGRLLASPKSMVSQSSWVPISFEIDNRENWLPGTLTEVTLNGTNIRNTIVIPKSALLEEQGALYVYIQTDGEHFEKRTVEPGLTDGDRIEILSGLAVGERLVVKGAYQIKLATTFKSDGHGHAH